MVHGDSHKPNVLLSKTLINQRIALHDVKQLRLKRICLTKEEDHILGLAIDFDLSSTITTLCDPSDVLINSNREGVSLSFTDAIVKFKDFHSFAPGNFTLHAMLVKS